MLAAGLPLVTKYSAWFSGLTMHWAASYARSVCLPNAPMPSEMPP
ncbi:Uncharacterised protein [Mycobacteroides abscessus]|nr:Uncharacterised protein [Mycobacteroides abscessus]